MEEFSLFDSPSWPKRHQALREMRGIKRPPAPRQVGEVLVSWLHQGPAVVERKSRCPFWGWGWHRYKGGWGHLHGPRPHKRALLVVNPAPSPVWGRPAQSFHISSTAGRKSIMWGVFKASFLKVHPKALAIHHFRGNICYTLSRKRCSQPPKPDGRHRYNCHSMYREIQCEKWKIMCSHTNGHWTRHRLIFHIMSSLRFE